MDMHLFAQGCYGSLSQKPINSGRDPCQFLVVCGQLLANSFQHGSNKNLEALV